MEWGGRQNDRSEVQAGVEAVSNVRPKIGTALLVEMIAAVIVPLHYCI